MLKNILLLLSVLTGFYAHAQTRLSQDSIISRYLKHGAWKYSYLSKQWDKYIAEGLQQDSTVAYLWQQRGMPLFKTRKYELAMSYLDKAVMYDDTWQDYRGFMKCIFCKTYPGAIEDFVACKRRYGNVYVMDHSYDFYIGLCYLQLNRFDEALKILKTDIDHIATTKGEDIVHHLDLFYLGIAYYELGQYDEAIKAFDRALKKYSNFSDVKYYKGLCLIESGKKEEGRKLLKEAKADFDKGFTVNEDSSFYEPYPYQVNWKMVHI